MDQEKIGKLIAKLRRTQGLTQQELGDKVGVGYRAVSKWECGQTLPDISIINDLSSILGITSDELLKGELKENHTQEKTKSKRNIILTFILILVIITSVILLIINKNNKTYVYDLASVDTDNYYVEGKVVFKETETSIIINKVLFYDKNFLQEKIKNYEYEISTGDKILYAYGYLTNDTLLPTETTINDFSQQFSINVISRANLEKKEILKNNIVITMVFMNSLDDEISKKIEITLTPSE